MNSKLVKASLAGVACIALAAGGSTFAAFSDFGDINDNSIGAGFLKLDLGNDGRGSAPLDWGRLAPKNMGATKTVWVASNNGDSVPDATLDLTIQNLRNQENDCSSNSERAIDDCDTNGAGELSKVLNVRAAYYPSILDPDACQAAVEGGYPAGSQSIFPANHPGDLDDYQGTALRLKNASGGDLVLEPGQGVCIALTSYWGDDQGRVADDAAQGDSLKFDAHFDLIQS